FEQQAVLATGLPQCVMGPSLASKQSMRPEGFREVSTMYGPIRAEGVAPQLVRLSRMQITGVPFAIYDLFNHFTSKQVTEAPQIWLGGSLLSAFTFTIDPEHQIVTFNSVATAPPPNAIKVPFELRDGRIYVQLK